MIAQEQVKELSNTELNEQLQRKMEVLGLCTDAVLNDHDCTIGICWAFQEAETLVTEMRNRFRKSSE